MGRKPNEEPTRYWRISIKADLARRFDLLASKNSPESVYGARSILFNELLELFLQGEISTPTFHQYLKQKGVINGRN